MQTFNGTLEVQVEQGTVAATKSLLFDLVGEGTLPHASNPNNPNLTLTP